MLDYHDDETFPNLMGVVNHFSEGLKRYRRGEWETAVDSFREALSLHAGDALSEMYIERCELLCETPPAGEWDGVWRMTSK